jgi:hypothetical protein
MIELLRSCSAVLTLFEATEFTNQQLLCSVLTDVHTIVLRLHALLLETLQVVSSSGDAAHTGNACTAQKLIIINFKSVCV